MSRFNDQFIDRLFQAVLSLENMEECYKFFEDVCTIPELKELGIRLEVANRLREKQKYSKICEETGASTATISRVSKCLQYGSGGYEMILKRIETNESEEK